MSCQIGVCEGIVSRIRVAVQILRIIEIGHDRIRRDKPAEPGIIVPRFIVVEVRAVIELLARELVGHIDRRGRKTLIRAGAAKGRIGERLDFGAGTVRDHARTPQVIPMPIVDGAVRDRHGRNASVVRPDEPAATGIRAGRLAFVQLADVAGRGGPDDLLHASAIAVIDEGGVDRGTAERGHGARQAIVDVKRRAGAVIAERTRDARLVAIVVVAIRIGTGNPEAWGRTTPGPLVG